MDRETSIMHLRLAIVGGMVITGAGLLSFFGFHHLPLASFTVGPLVSFVAWRGLRDLQRRKQFAVIRVTAPRRGRKF